MQLNNESVSLTWTITLPGQMPLSITYDSSSALDSLDNIVSSVRTKLTEFRSDQYIESIMIVTVTNSFSLNGSEVECRISNLINDSTSATVFINTAGM